MPPRVSTLCCKSDARGSSFALSKAMATKLYFCTSVHEME